MVFYRKYRPQTIHDLDLDSVREKLTAILQSSLDNARDVPHAFLFTGPKGLGKTSSARILAKAINCEQRIAGSRLQIAKKNDKKAISHKPSAISQIEPCNICDACVSITNGSAIDVLEIDAASNRGIDEIRDLRDKIKFAPSSLAKKVYIIDEVHMLTTEAFNALLKTLEEPPDHAVFILCTTESWKLPQTIVSRAFGIQFEKPDKAELLRSLSRVVEGEKLDLENGVLDKVFELADGAFRDGAKILEELALSSPNKKITNELLEKIYKSGSIDQEVGELLVHLSQKNAKSGLETIAKLASNGCDFKVVIERIVEELRYVLLQKSGLKREGAGLSHLEGDITLHLEDFQLSGIETLLEYFSGAYKNLKFSPIPQLPLELVVVKWCILGEENSKSVYPASGREIRNPNQTQNTKPENVPKENMSSPTGSGIQGSPINVGSTKNNGSGSVLSLDSRFHGNDKDLFLKNLISAIQKENFSIAGVLRSCSLISIMDSEVKIQAPFKFHGDKLRDTKVTAMLENSAKGLIGHDVTFIISVKGE